MDTYIIIKAIYILEFSFGFEQASVVRPLRGDLSVEQTKDSRKSSNRVKELDNVRCQMGKETSEIGGWAENALLGCFRGGPSGTWLDKWQTLKRSKPGSRDRGAKQTSCRQATTSPARPSSQHKSSSSSSSTRSSTPGPSTTPPRPPYSPSSPTRSSPSSRPCRPTGSSRPSSTSSTAPARPGSSAGASTTRQRSPRATA